MVGYSSPSLHDWLCASAILIIYFSYFDDLKTPDTFKYKPTESIKHVALIFLPYQVNCEFVRGNSHFSEKTSWMCLQGMGTIGLFLWNASGTTRYQILCQVYIALQIWDWLKCGLWAAGCGPQIAGCWRVGCGPQIAGCGPQIAGCGPQIAGCGPQIRDCRLRAAGHRLQAEGMRAAGHRVPAMGHRLRAAGKVRGAG